MRLQKETNGKCEMGRCGKRVSFSLRMDRAGIKSRIFICDERIVEMARVLSEFLVPKSIETIKKREGFSVREGICLGIGKGGRFV